VRRRPLEGYRFFHVAWNGNIPKLSCREEGLIHGDDVPANDPDGCARLVEYSRQHPADVDLHADDVQPNLLVLPREQFVEGAFRDIAYKPTGERFERASVVGFNLPFDLSRLAWDALGHPPSREWTLLLWRYMADGSFRENAFNPRLKILHIDSKRALKRFAGTAGRDIEDMIPEGLTEPYLRYWFRGHLLDLRTLGFALRNRGFTLASACEEFGVSDGKTELERFGVIDEPSIDYNQNDVRITAELWAKMMSEFLTHPIDLAPEQAFSPASIGTGYLREMGVTPPRERLGLTPTDLSWDQVLGACMASYYGVGRSAGSDAPRSPSCWWTSRACIPPCRR